MKRKLVLLFAMLGMFSIMLPGCKKKNKTKELNTESKEPAQTEKSGLGDFDKDIETSDSLKDKGVGGSTASKNKSTQPDAFDTDFLVDDNEKPKTSSSGGSTKSKKSVASSKGKSSSEKNLGTDSAQKKSNAKNGSVNNEKPKETGKKQNNNKNSEQTANNDQKTKGSSEAVKNNEDVKSEDAKKILQELMNKLNEKNSSSSKGEGTSHSDSAKDQKKSNEAQSASAGSEKQGTVASSTVVQDLPKTDSAAQGSSVSSNNAQNSNTNGTTNSVSSSDKKETVAGTNS